MDNWLVWVGRERDRSEKEEKRIEKHVLLCARYARYALGYKRNFWRDV